MKKALKLNPSGMDVLPEGRHVDPQTPGLCVIVDADGRKTWIFRRRISRSDVIVELRLGAFPAFTIAAARQWASSLNEVVVRGEDPRIAMRLEKARNELTVEKAHGLYLGAMQRGDRKKLKPRTLSDKVAIYGRDIHPRLGKKSLLALTEDECWDGAVAPLSEPESLTTIGEMHAYAFR